MQRQGSLVKGRSCERVSPKPIVQTSSRVSFSDANKTIVVEPPHADGQNASWYSKHELQNFRKSSKGPGFLSPKKDFVLSVLEIQRTHKELGIQDPKGLSQVSKVASRESLKRAIARAQEILHSED
jgi:hypothetical protein